MLELIWYFVAAKLGVTLQLGLQREFAGVPKAPQGVPKRLPKGVKAAATAPQSTPKGAILALLAQQGFSRGPKRL